MSRAAALSIVLLLVATGTATAAFAADVSFSESFETLDRANDSNNVTINNDNLRPLDETLNWDVDNETLIKARDVPNADGSPRNVEWGRNGTRLYVLSGVSPSEIYQYNVADPYNVSSASFALSTTLNGDFRGLEFSPHGQYLLTVESPSGPDTDQLHRYALSTNWQIAPVSLDATRDLFGLVDPTDVQASPGGSNFYVADSETRRYTANESVQWFADELVASTNSVDPETIEFEGNNTYLNFSGLNSGDYVEVQDSGMTELDVTGDVTVAFRAHVYQQLDQNANNNFRHMVGKTEGVGQYGVIFEEGGTIDFSVFKGGSRENIRGCDFPIGKNFTVVATHDTSTGESRIYLNGTQCGSGTVSTGPLDTDNNNVFVSSNNGDRQPPAQMDDVLLDASFYSESDASEYDNDSGTPTDSRLSLNFSSGIGTTAVDGAGTRNDGAINNPDWESGLFGPAGDTLIVQKDNRTMFELTADDYRIGSSSVVDSDKSPELTNQSLNGLAWDPDGDVFTTTDSHRSTPLALETYNGGYEPNPYATYVYDDEQAIQATKLKWEIVNESMGDVDMFVGVRNGPDGPQRLTRVGVDGVDQEDVWQATSADWTHVVVRVEPEWDGESRWPPSIDQFQVGADLVDDVAPDGIALATGVFVIALLSILMAGALSLRSALFAALSGVGTLLVALWAAGILATSTTVLLLGLLLAGGTLAAVLAWEVL